MSRFFVTCARGLEEILSEELKALGCKQFEIAPGGVQFEGDQELLYKAHLWLRTGNRILLQLRSFPCMNPETLYDNLKKFKWETFFQKPTTFAVDCTLSGRNHPALSHSQYAKLKAKDAIVDRLREKLGTRPDVDVENPDLRVVLYVRDNVCTLNLDASGFSLHERGYRSNSAEAPLKETLAAGLISLMGWKGECAFVDPMCGSGTLLAEAALIATNTAPGLLRDHFLFMNWPDYYETRWKALVSEAEQARRPLEKNLIFGFDESSEALKQSKFALKRLGFSDDVILERRSFLQFEKPSGLEKGLLLVNPPYGDRLGNVDELKPLYKHFGDTFKKQLKGWKAGIFTGSSELSKSVGLKTSRRIPLWNGPIECRLLTYDLY